MTGYNCHAGLSVSDDVILTSSLQVACSQETTPTAFQTVSVVCEGRFLNCQVWTAYSCEISNTHLPSRPVCSGAAAWPVRQVNQSACKSACKGTRLGPVVSSVGCQSSCIRDSVQLSEVYSGPAKWPCRAFFFRALIQHPARSLQPLSDLLWLLVICQKRPGNRCAGSLWVDGPSQQASPQKNSCLNRQIPARQCWK